VLDKDGNELRVTRSSSSSRSHTDTLADVIRTTLLSEFHPDQIPEELEALDALLADLQRLEEALRIIGFEPWAKDPRVIARAALREKPQTAEVYWKEAGLDA